MVWLIRKCTRCGKYTLKKDRCSYCGGKTHIPHPARFSPDDRYGIYKGMMRSQKNERNHNNNERKS